ncbi:MAG: hypothetical protein WAW17_21345 [Rhodococcus sp. (in: high G+C Gram-positive bacteria)]|uniref:hypothetical protein n=1 Tax=Rhodococcus sp. TaxID=1831 RepID=UPI003BB0AB14
MARLCGPALTPGGWAASFGYLTFAVVIVIIAGSRAGRPRMLEDGWRPEKPLADAVRHVWVTWPKPHIDRIGK